MLVLQVTPQYFPNIGGVETVVQKISEILSRKGISVIVYSVDLAPNQPIQQEINGVLVKRFKPLVSDPLYIPDYRFIRSIRRENVDVLHVHNIHTFLPGITALLKHKNQKLLLQPHYHRFGQTFLRHILFSGYKRILRKLIFSYIDCVIVNSPYEKKIFLEDFKKAKNLLLIPQGVAVDELSFIGWKPEEPIRILYVGGLRRYKNVDKLLEAFEKLVEIKKNKFKLIIIGKGPEYTHLVNLARKLKILDFIEWKQNLSRQQLLLEYSKASVFVLLSPLESFSRVVYEALLIGVPTVVLNTGATASLIERGFAIGVNSLKPSEIARGILKATSSPRIKIGSKSAFFLNWDRYIDRLLEVYHMILRR